MNDELFEKLTTFIQEENRKQTEAITRDFKIEINKIKSDLIEIKETLEEEAKKTKDLAEKYTKLEKKCVSLERSMRKNNVIVFGLDNKSDNLAEDTIKQLNEHLALNLAKNNINNIRVIGAKDQHNRPIIIEFISFFTKLEVLKNCKKLKGSHISISDDLVEEDRTIRKKLLAHQKLARSKSLRSYIKGNRLVVNDEIYTLEELELESTDEIIDKTRQNTNSNNISPTPSVSAVGLYSQGIPANHSPEADKKRKLEISPPEKIPQNKTKRVATISTRSNSKNRVVCESH